MCRWCRNFAHKKGPHSHSIAGGSCSAGRHRAENKTLQRQRGRGITPLHTPTPPVESWSHPIRSSSMASLDARHRRRLCTPASVLIIACLVSLLAGLLFGEHAWVCCSVTGVVGGLQHAASAGAAFAADPASTAVHSPASRSEAAAKRERACARFQALCPWWLGSTQAHMVHSCMAQWKGA